MKRTVLICIAVALLVVLFSGDTRVSDTMLVSSTM